GVPRERGPAEQFVADGVGKVLDRLWVFEAVGVRASTQFGCGGHLNRPDECLVGFDDARLGAAELEIQRLEGDGTRWLTRTDAWTVELGDVEDPVARTRGSLEAVLPEDTCV